MRFHAEPYLYVGPWGPERPGDPAYWNAPFGAILPHARLRAADDARGLAEAFLRRGLDLLAERGGAMSTDRAARWSGTGWPTPTRWRTVASRRSRPATARSP